MLPTDSLRISEIAILEDKYQADFLYFS